MTNEQVKKAMELIPNFIKVVENDLEEEQHADAREMTCEEFELIYLLQKKLENCINYVDQSIFI